MRKDKDQQKKTACGQLKLFTRKGEPDDGKAGGSSNATETGAELPSRLDQQRALTENILERIVDYGNIDKAYRQVKSNDGSSGIDGMEVEELGQWLGGHLKEMQESILQQQYEVSAVRKVEIPKPTGEIRMLGIPNVKERLIQQAIHQELNRHYEPYFSEHS